MLFYFEFNFAKLMVLPIYRTKITKKSAKNQIFNFSIFFVSPVSFMISSIGSPYFSFWQHIFFGLQLFLFELRLLFFEQGFIIFIIFWGFCFGKDREFFWVFGKKLLSFLGWRYTKMLS